MTAAAPKLVLVVCSDHAMQASLRSVVEEAGCRAALAASVAAAQRELDRIVPVLILIDPLCGSEVPALVADCAVVEFPVRTSSTGVRRIAKRHDAGVKWLKELVASHCALKHDQ